MEIIVGVWSRRTQTPLYNNQSVHQKVGLIDTALNNLSVSIAARMLPNTEPIHGIFVAPEYLFAKNDHGKDIAGGGFHERSISEHKKNSIVTIMQGLSANYPKILIVPGTIAWKKVFDAVQNDRYNAANDIQQHMAHNVPGLNLPPPRIAQRGFGHKLHTGGKNKISQYLLANHRYRDTVQRLVCQDRGVAPQNFTFQELLAAFSDYGDLFEDVRKRAGLINNQDYNKSRNLQQKIAVVQDPNCTYMMRNTAYVFLDGNTVCEYNKQGDFHEAIGAKNDTVFVPGGESGDQDIHGIKFGFEICLDHNIGFARGQSTDLKDIHILCSAAVSNKAENRPVAIEGCAIHACSTHAYSGVWTKSDLGHNFTDAPSVGVTTLIGADPFKKYRIDIEENYGLGGLFD